MDLLSTTGAALAAADALLARARSNLAGRVARGGAIDAAALDAEQLAAHGFAWMATYVAALRQLRGWAARLDEAGECGEIERLILGVGFAEYLAQLAGGIAMGQGEIARPHDLGLDDADLAGLRGAAVPLLAELGLARLRLAALLAEGLPQGYGALGLADPTLELIRDQVRRFAEHAVAPYAHDWHRQDRLIPIEGTPPSLINVPSGCPFHPRCQYTGLTGGRCPVEVPLLQYADPGHQAACHLTAAQRAEIRGPVRSGSGRGKHRGEER